jgi:hypothetical protein
LYWGAVATEERVDWVNCSERAMDPVSADGLSWELVQEHRAKIKRHRREER